MDLELLKAFSPMLLAICAMFGWLWRKQHTRIDNLEDRVASVEKSTAVIQVMVDNIREDIREIKHLLEKLAQKHEK